MFYNLIVFKSASFSVKSCGAGKKEGLLLPQAQCKISCMWAQFWCAILQWKCWLNQAFITCSHWFMPNSLYCHIMSHIKELIWFKLFPQCYFFQPDSSSWSHKNSCFGTTVCSVRVGWFKQEWNCLRNIPSLPKSTSPTKLTR